MLGIWALTLQSVQGALLIMINSRDLDGRAVFPGRHDLRAAA